MNIRAKVHNRKGGVTLLEILVAMGLITFFIFFPPTSFILQHKQNMLEETLSLGLQMAAKNGGLTDTVEEAIYQNLSMRGLLPSTPTQDDKDSVHILCNAGGGGRAAPATPPEGYSYIDGNIYKYSADPMIVMEIRYPATSEIAMINGLMRLIGASLNADTSQYYVKRGAILSEEVDY